MQRVGLRRASAVDFPDKLPGFVLQRQIIAFIPVLASFAVGCTPQQASTAPFPEANPPVTSSPSPMSTQNSASAPALSPTHKPTTTPTLTLFPLFGDSTPRYTFRIINTYPHDTEAFTEGLIIEDDVLYESTGLRGESTLREVDLETGEILLHVALDPDLFGEGLTMLGDILFQLTLSSGRGFVYERETFSLLDEFSFEPQGWGLTHDGNQLIMSDGSADLRFLDPQTFQETGRIRVTDQGIPIHSLNELEYVEGEIFANVWQTDLIVRISPETGEVLGWIDLSGIRGDRPAAGVLNGIAYDPDGRRLYVTGKNWPELFEIELIAEDSN